MELQSSEWGVLVCRTCKVNIKILQRSQSVTEWTCGQCDQEITDVLPFQNNSEIAETSIVDSESGDVPTYTQLFPTGIKFLYNNINGIRSKFTEVHNILTNERNVLLFSLSETKLKPSDITT